MMQPELNPSKYMLAIKFVRLKGYSANTHRYWVLKHNFPMFKYNGHYYVDIQEAEEWLRQYQIHRQGGR